MDTRTQRCSLFAGVSGSSGRNDGPLLKAKFSSPRGMVLDSKGNAYVADNGNSCIRKIDIEKGMVSLFCGNPQGRTGNTDSAVPEGCYLYYPNGITIDQYDNLYIGDSGNNQIRKITTTTPFQVTKIPVSPNWISDVGSHFNHRLFVNQHLMSTQLVPQDLLQDPRNVLLFVADRGGSEVMYLELTPEGKTVRKLLFGFRKLEIPNVQSSALQSVHRVYALQRDVYVTTYAPNNAAVLKLTLKQNCSEEHGVVESGETLMSVGTPAAIPAPGVRTPAMQVSLTGNIYGIVGDPYNHCMYFGNDDKLYKID